MIRKKRSSELLLKMLKMVSGKLDFSKNVLIIVMESSMILMEFQKNWTIMLVLVKLEMPLEILRVGILVLVEPL